MVGIVAPNLASFVTDDAAVVARNAEVPGSTLQPSGEDPLSDVDGDGNYDVPYLGMNRTGSNAPGIGICTGDVHVTAADLALTPPAQRFDNWTELDQGVKDAFTPAARTPQVSTVLGNSGFVDRTVATGTWVGGGSGGESGKAEDEIRVAGNIPDAVDFNNTLNLVVTDTAAVDGADMDVGGTGALNNTGATVGIGDLIWGQVVVA